MGKKTNSDVTLTRLIDAGFNEFVKNDRTNKSVLSKAAVLLGKFISEWVRNELFSIWNEIPAVSAGFRLNFELIAMFSLVSSAKRFGVQTKSRSKQPNMCCKCRKRRRKCECAAPGVHQPVIHVTIIQMPSAGKENKDVTIEPGGVQTHYIVQCRSKLWLNWIRTLSDLHMLFF